MGQNIGPATESCMPEIETCPAAMSVTVCDDAQPPFDAVDEANCLLLRASQEGDIMGIENALDEGADINTRLPRWIRIDTMCDKEKPNNAKAQTPGPKSFTPLMNAASEGHVEVVQLLLNLNADPELSDADGMRALHFAGEAASVGCFRALLQAGADPLATDDLDRDALQCVPLALICHNSEQQQWLSMLKEASGICPLVGGTAEEQGTKLPLDIVAPGATTRRRYSVPNQHRRCRSRTV